MGDPIRLFQSRNRETSLFRGMPAQILAGRKTLFQSRNRDTSLFRISKDGGRSGEIWKVSISQSRDFSFQEAVKVQITDHLGHVSISQSRYFSFQVGGGGAVDRSLVSRVACFNLAIEILLFSGHTFAFRLRL